MNSVIINYLNYKNQIEEDLFKYQFSKYNQTYMYNLQGNNFINIECKDGYALRLNGLYQSKKYDMEFFLIAHPIIFIAIYNEYYKTESFKNKEMNNALRKLRTGLKSMSKTLRCQMSSPE